MTLTPQFPRDAGPCAEKKQPGLLMLRLKSERALLGRHSRRLKVKRAKELELVVVDKRAKRKESRVLDSNGESGALGGPCLSCERGKGGVGDEF